MQAKNNTENTSWYFK